MSADAEDEHRRPEQPAVPIHSMCYARVLTIRRVQDVLGLMNKLMDMSRKESRSAERWELMALALWTKIHHCCARGGLARRGGLDTGWLVTPT